MYGIEDKIKEKYKEYFHVISPDWEAQIERIVGLTIQFLEEETTKQADRKFEELVDLNRRIVPPNGGEGQPTG